MKYIKAAVWIFVLSLVYASGILRIFNISAELLMIFCGIFAFLSESFRASAVVSIICAVLMSGLGGRGFAFCVLSCVYFALLCLWVRPTRKPMLKFTVVGGGYAFIFEAAFYLLFCRSEMDPAAALRSVICPSFVYNTLLCMILYPAVRKSFEEKERYIFEN
ncbi:MAG: hypothetical protein J6N52_09070 [Clostridia bacterium]|nr:hypothetical protein [Clostridia bacterium]